MIGVAGANVLGKSIRATLGRLLFSGDETKKSVTVISGGEEGRSVGNTSTGVASAAVLA